MCIHNGMIQWIKTKHQIKSTLYSRKFSLPNIMQVKCDTFTVFYASAVLLYTITGDRSWGVPPSWLILQKPVEYLGCYSCHLCLSGILLRVCIDKSRLVPPRSTVQSVYINTHPGYRVFIYHAYI